ncbi:Rha family transcriptional regulator [Brevibacillus sp. H7]|uniref:Rha family transcriptional regulator n=1 Tax=Brevibacillus sp. H7 TaxID=3349138 RepID=UPI00380CE7C7
MNQLVFIENGRPLTDSLIVAEVFGKNHADVLRDIRNLGCSDEFRLSNFAESSYINLQGRQMPKMDITRDGFTFLVMGYTGKEAAQFKEDYIKAFNQMEQHLKQFEQNKVVPLSERQALIKSLQLTVELAEEMEEVKSIAQSHSQKLIELEQKVDEQITLDHGEQRALQKAVSRRVYEIEADSQRRRELFQQLHREIKDRWAVASYRDVRRQELQQVLRYIDAWMPRRVS